VSPKSIGVYGLYRPAAIYVQHLQREGHTVAVSDADEKRREAFDGEGDVITTESLSDLIDLPLDGLVVATPNRYHRKPIELAADADIPVLVHKPLAHDLETAREIQSIVSEASVDGFVSFRHRCGTAIRRLKSMIEDGQFGRVYHVEATFGRRSGIPALGSWMTSSDLSGGGALIDLGVLYVDTCLHLLSFPEIERATGVVRQTFDPREYGDEAFFDDPGTRNRSDVEDSATVVASFANGTSMSVDVHWSWNRPKREEFHMYGDDGGALVDFETETFQVYGTEESEHRDVDLDVEDWSVETIHRRIDCFLRELDGESTPLASINEGVRVQDVVERVYADSTLE
jgi:predicted dehydrogenase